MVINLPRPNNFDSADPYFKITGTEVNIFGTNNSIEVESAAARNLSIFGSNFTLSTQEQLVNAYYIGNPFPAGGLLSRLFVAADGGSYFTGDVISFALSDCSTVQWLPKSDWLAKFCAYS